MSRRKKMRWLSSEEIKRRERESMGAPPLHARKAFLARVDRGHG
jgi:hypothetical protein